jgi:hypothetical protein
MSVWLSAILANNALASPDSLYFVLVDRFADGRSVPEEAVDPSEPQAWHGGDLAGILAHYDEIPGNGLWLSPIQLSRTDPVGEWGAFHGYWTVDLNRLEPRLATEAELKTLSTRLHADGRELWLDLVTNHVGYDAPLIQQHPDWFHGKGDVVDWSDPVQAVTHDVHGLPDLAVEKPEVYAYVLAAASHWVRTAKPTGFRVDAVRHLPVGFLKQLRTDLRAIDPKLQLLGEVFDGDPEALAERQRADALDRVFDFPLHYALKDAMCGGDLGRLAAVVAQDAVYDDPSSLVTFLDNHDVPRIRSACGGDLDAVARALAVLTWLRGTPCITWGTEAGLQGAAEPANRADMVWGPHPLRHALDALLALREAHDALGRVAPTRVLEFEASRVVLARRGVTSTAAIVVAGPQGTEWPVAGLGQGCKAYQVLGVAGPVEVPVAATLALAPGAVGAVVCTGEPVPAVAAVFDKARPLAEVRLEVPEGHVLVGAGPALGRWNPDAGLVKSQVLKVPSGSVLEYKLVRKGPDGWVWPEGKNAVVLVR